MMMMWRQLWVLLLPVVMHQQQARIERIVRLVRLDRQVRAAAFAFVGEGIDRHQRLRSRRAIHLAQSHDFVGLGDAVGKQFRVSTTIPIQFGEFFFLLLVLMMTLVVVVVVRLRSASFGCTTNRTASTTFSGKSCLYLDRRGRRRRRLEPPLRFKDQIARPVFCVAPLLSVLSIALPFQTTSVQIALHETKGNQIVDSVRLGMFERFVQQVTVEFAPFATFGPTPLFDIIKFGRTKPQIPVINIVGYDKGPASVVLQLKPDRLLVLLLRAHAAIATPYHGRRRRQKKIKSFGRRCRKLAWPFNSATDISRLVREQWWTAGRLVCWRAVMQSASSQGGKSLFTLFRGIIITYQSIAIGDPS
jgi:hypothetical protein